MAPVRKDACVLRPTVREHETVRITLSDVARLCTPTGSSVVVAYKLARGDQVAAGRDVDVDIADFTGHGRRGHLIQPTHALPCCAHTDQRESLEGERQKLQVGVAKGARDLDCLGAGLVCDLGVPFHLQCQMALPPGEQSVFDRDLQVRRGAGAHAAANRCRRPCRHDGSSAPSTRRPLRGRRPGGHLDPDRDETPASRLTREVAASSRKKAAAPSPSSAFRSVSRPRAPRRTLSEPAPMLRHRARSAPP